MGTQADDSLWSLTEKEKQTLRLMVRGHDAKSIARTLDLSVHTINERLRDARRKMAVPSSREAARLLLAAEEARDATPESVGDTRFGADPAPVPGDPAATPPPGVPRAPSRSRLIAGALVMSLVLGLLALAAAPSLIQETAPAVTAPAEDDVVRAARSFLVLGDEQRWDDAYRLTGAAFQQLNTPAVWARAGQRVRVPLGAVQSRTLMSHKEVPAPPSGYDVVEFRTRFANKSADVVETVTLSREGDAWRVVGVTVG